MPEKLLSHPYTGTGILLLSSLAAGVAVGGPFGAGVAIASVLQGACGPIGNHVFEKVREKSALRAAFEDALHNEQLAKASARAIHLCIAKTAQQWRGKPEAAEAAKLAAEAEKQWLHVLAERDQKFEAVWEENLPAVLMNRLAGGADGDDVEGKAWEQFIVRTYAALKPSPALTKSNLRTIAGGIAEQFPERLFDALKQDLETGGAQFGGMVLRNLSLISAKLEKLPTADELLQRIEAMLDWHFSEFPALKEAIREEGSATRVLVGREADRIISRIDRLEKSLDPKARRPHRTWQQQLTAYESACTPGWQRLPIAELSPDGDCRDDLTLSGLFVEPAVDTRTLEIAVEENVPAKAAQTTVKLTSLQSTRRFESAIAELCNEQIPHQVLLGDAGYGKSSVLRNLYIRWALAFQSGGEAGPVPILIEVREYLATRTKYKNGEIKTPIEDLIDYLTEPCGRPWCFEREDLLAAFDKGQAWLLIDGLDEAFAPATRKELYQWITAFARTHGGARIIVTSRTIGFPVDDWWRDNQTKHSNKWDIHTLAPFDEKRTSDFLDRWFPAEVAGTELSSSKRREVGDAIRDRPYLKPLAEVPLTLTLLCITGQRGSTATGRAELYREAIRIFLGKWDAVHHLPKEQAEIASHFRDHGEKGRTEFFKSVAAHMTRSGNPNTSNSITRKALHGILKKQFEAAGNPNPDAHAEGILELICIRNFLLVERSGGTFAFFHRSFLEYFTALHWESHADGASDQKARKFFREFVEPRWQDETWHETLRFLFARLSISETPYGHPLALRCLDLLAKKKPVVVDEETKHPEPLGLVYAVDFLQEVESSFTQAEAGKKKAGAALTKIGLAELWKPKVFKYARSSAGGILERLEWRRRALVALAANWRGNLEVAWEFAALLRVKMDWLDLDRAIGEALAVLAPGRSEIFWLLVDLLLEPHRSGDIAFGGLTAPVADSGANTKATQIAGTTLSPTRMSPLLRLAPFLDNAVRDTMREGAVSALADGWAGEPETKAALLLVLIGVPEPCVAPSKQAIPPDEDDAVRLAAAWQLGWHWQGDAEVKEALLRVLIGIPERGKTPAKQKVPPDLNWEVRYHPPTMLCEGWKGDAEVKAALELLATGTSADGAPIEEDEFIRTAAKKALDNWTK